MLGAVHSFYKNYVTGIFFWQLRSLTMKTCVWKDIYFTQLKGTSFCLNQCQQPAHKRQQYIKTRRLGFRKLINLVHLGIDDKAFFLPIVSLILLKQC